MKIPIEVLELHRFASDDPERSNLHWIKIERAGPGSLRATATNGFMLAQYSWRNDEDLTKHDLFIDAAELAQCIKKATKANRMLGADISPADQEVKIHALPAWKVPMTFETNFPDAAQVIPAHDTIQSDPVGVDLQYLVVIHGWMKAVKWETTVRWQATGELSPIRLDHPTPDCGEVMFVVMPCRL